MVIFTINPVAPQLPAYLSVKAGVAPSTRPSLQSFGTHKASTSKFQILCLLTRPSLQSVHLVLYRLPLVFGAADCVSFVGLDSCQHTADGFADTGPDSGLQGVAPAIVSAKEDVSFGSLRRPSFLFAKAVFASAGTLGYGNNLDCLLGGC